ncbi:hypothetical protein OEZ86_004628 [Tetradesmus obliquus]|nr:hypothetical protein OEZ86_004628 [Tetradesmus obliquus]
MGRAPAVCPAHPNECKHYKCDVKTGMCAGAFPKPDWSACPGGYCQAGLCGAFSDPCTRYPDPNKGHAYSYDQPRCKMVATQCTQQPPDPCKMVRCTPKTGLCTTVTKRPDGTACPGGKCLSGVCNAKSTPCATCPTHSNPCKVFLCNTTSSQCTREAKRAEKTTCPGGACKAGVCMAAKMQCPTPCANHTNLCKAWECNPAIGVCDVEVNRPYSPCSPGVENACCLDGDCVSIDPPDRNPNACTTWKWNASSCSYFGVQKDDYTTCSTGGNVCIAGECVPDNRRRCTTDCPAHEKPCKA